MAGSGGVGTKNVPAQRQPPRDLQLKPATYLFPAGQAFVTALITTPRVATDMGRSPLRAQDFTFSTKVTRLPPTQQLLNGDPLESARSGLGPHAKFPISTFADTPARISETCKFNPDEQHRLIGFRRKLATCEEELRALYALLEGDQGAASGLPNLREAERSRLRGRSYSIEDAQRELLQPWLLERLGGYIAFVDRALEDRLDPALAVGSFNADTLGASAISARASSASARGRRPSSAAASSCASKLAEVVVAGPAAAGPVSDGAAAAAAATTPGSERRERDRSSGGFRKTPGFRPFGA